MSGEPQPTTGEKLAPVAILLATVAVMALAVVALLPVVGTGAGLWLTVVAAVVVGVLLFIAAVFGIDRWRRGGAAARALGRVRVGDAGERMRGVEMLCHIGTSAVFMIRQVQKDGRGGAILGGLVVWQEQRLLNRYVIPGLRVTAQDTNAWVQQAARQALQQIGTWEALAILNEVGTGGRPEAEPGAAADGGA